MEKKPEPAPPGMEDKKDPEEKEGESEAKENGEKKEGEDKEDKSKTDALTNGENKGRFEVHFVWIAL